MVNELFLCSRRALVKILLVLLCCFKILKTTWKCSEEDIKQFLNPAFKCTFSFYFYCFDASIVFFGLQIANMMGHVAFPH